jgi:hypothetical protein
MRTIIALILMTFSAICLSMNATDTMQKFIWKHRVLIIFAPDSANTKLSEQNAILSQAAEGLAERDVRILRVFADGEPTLDNVQQQQSSKGFYQLCDVDPAQFRVILIGKDGSVKLEQSVPVSAGTLFGLIDAMPMRQYEMLQHDD